jgi:hypothetical protein
VQKERIGTGQIGKCIRFALDFAGDPDGAPRSLVGKFASDDPLSRETGIQLGNYHREVMFYRELAERIPIDKPRCYYAEIEGRGADFALLLEDMAPAVQGNQMAGCSVPIARGAVRELVKLHAPTWQDESLRGKDWIEERTPDKGAVWREMYRASLAPFLARFAPVLADDEREIIARVAESKGPPFSYPSEPWALVHIDFRLDNLLIDERVTPPRVAVVDEKSVVHYTKVEIRHDYGAEVEVTAGLKGGETVVVHPGDAIPEGTLVQPVAPAKDVSQNASAP